MWYTLKKGEEEALCIIHVYKLYKDAHNCTCVNGVYIPVMYNIQVHVHAHMYSTGNSLVPVGWEGLTTIMNNNDIHEQPTNHNHYFGVRLYINYEPGHTALW